MAAAGGNTSPPPHCGARRSSRAPPRKSGCPGSVDRLLEVAVGVVARRGGVHAVTLGNRQWRAPGRPSTYQTSSYRLNPAGRVLSPMTRVTRGREFKPPGQAISGISDGHHAPVATVAYVRLRANRVTVARCTANPAQAWPGRRLEVGGDCMKARFVPVWRRGDRGGFPGARRPLVLVPAAAPGGGAHFRVRGQRRDERREASAGSPW